MKTAKWLDGIQLSGIRRMFDMASKDAVHLGLGEPDFQPPPVAQEALFNAVKEGANKYGPTNGLPILRQGIADHLNNMYADAKYQAKFDGEELNADNIIVTCSGSEALACTARTYYEVGDEILMPDPGFVLYGPQAILSGAVPVKYPIRHENAFVPQIDELQELLTPKTKALIVNSPNNPTGGVMDSADVDAIARFADDNNLLLISDEVYDKVVYDRPHESFLGRSNNVVMINSFSKTYAMTGWRIGYLVASKEIAPKISLSHYYNVACPPTPLQHAVLASLEHGDQFIADMVKEYKERRDLIVDMLNEIEGIDCLRPHGAFYAFPKYSYDVKAEDFALECVKNNLICSPGTAFGAGGEGHMRFSYATSKDKIREGIEIFAKVCAKYQ